MVTLLKFFLFLILIVYIFRLISPYIVKYLISRLSKKTENFYGDLFYSPPKKEPKKTSEEEGEYIDYEEID